MSELPVDSDQDATFVDNGAPDVVAAPDAALDASKPPAEAGPDASVPPDAAPDASTPPVEAGPDTAVQPDAPISPTIGDAFPEITQLVVQVNLSDGFFLPYANDVYAVDFVAGTAWFNDQPPVPVATGELDGLAALVRGTSYRTIDECYSVFIDGGCYPPSIIVSGSSTSQEFGESDEECAPTDHDHYGDVVSCSDFQAIHAATLAVLGMAQPPAPCISYGF